MIDVRVMLGIILAMIAGVVIVGGFFIFFVGTAEAFIKTASALTLLVVIGAIFWLVSKKVDSMPEEVVSQDTEVQTYVLKKYKEDKKENTVMFSYDGPSGLPTTIEMKVGTDVRIRYEPVENNEVEVQKTTSTKRRTFAGFYKEDIGYSYSYVFRLKNS